MATTFDKALWRAVQVLDAFIEYNIEISPMKFQHGEVLVFGGNILELGVVPSYLKIVEFKQYNKCHCQRQIKDAQGLLGMIHQLKQWYPRLSMNTRVMQTLTWKTVKYVYMAAMEKEFQELKEYLDNVQPLSAPMVFRPPY